MSNQKNISMKHKKNIAISRSSIKISTNTINVPMSQMKTRELLMCNQDMGTRWSTHQMPCLLHLKFKFDPLRLSSVESPFCGPRISAHAFSTRWWTRFLFEKWFYWLGKMIRSRYLFLFYFLKRINKIRKKTLSMTPHFEKGNLLKIGSSSRVRLLVGKVQ